MTDDRAERVRAARHQIGYLGVHKRDSDNKAMYDIYKLHSDLDSRYCCLFKKVFVPLPGWHDTRTAAKLAIVYKSRTEGNGLACYWADSDPLCEKYKMPPNESQKPDRDILTDQLKYGATFTTTNMTFPSSDSPQTVPHQTGAPPRSSYPDHLPWS